VEDSRTLAHPKRFWQHLGFVGSYHAVVLTDRRAGTKVYRDQESMVYACKG
jgi:hypothetical protein